MTSTEPHLRIGDLARRTGKSTRALHLYEELGLLEPVSRSSGGFRLYDAEAVERVHWIDLFHQLGFSLQDMRGVIAGWWNAELGPAAMNDLRGLFERKLEETRELMVKYRQLEQELEQGLAYLETCRECATPETTVEGCVHCKQDHGMQEPALLAGIVTPPGSGKRPARSNWVRVQDIR